MFALKMMGFFGYILLMMICSSIPFLFGVYLLQFIGWFGFVVGIIGALIVDSVFLSKMDVIMEWSIR